MKLFNIKTLPIYLLLIIYLLFSTFYGYKIPTTMSSIINPLFYIGLYLFALLLTNKQFPQRIKGKTNKLQIIFILVISYLMIEIFLGLIVGYHKSIYSHTPISMIKNIWTYITPIIFMEYIRNILIRNTGEKNIFFFSIVVIFTLMSLNLHNILSSNYTNTEIFKLIFFTIIPTITTNLLLTYISKTAGYEATLTYQLPQSITMIILPILPDLNLYFDSLLEILLVIVTYFTLKNIDNKIESKKSRIRFHKIRIIPILIPIIIVSLFIVGVFKYKPIAIMSNSMNPIYQRGDVAIIEKYDQTILNNLKKYDIIVYMLDGNIITHRIIYIEKHNNGKKLYITKGDNNKISDKQKVTEEQIVGKVIFTIPKIGYPSVWLHELFTKKEESVET